MYPIYCCYSGFPVVTVPQSGSRLFAGFSLCQLLSLSSLLVLTASAAPLFAAGSAPLSLQTNYPIVDAGDRNPEPRHHAVPGANALASTAAGITVNINLATASELADKLPGIGPQKAQRIVAWRDSNGPFLRVEQLLDVSGIGPKTLEKIRPFVHIDDSASLHRDIPHQHTAESAVVTALSAVVEQLERDRSLALGH